MKKESNMKVNNVSPSFGIKIPVKTAIESATGVFLEDAKISYPRQMDLFEQLSGLDTKKLYTGEVSEGFKGVSRVIKEKFPNIAFSADRISQLCKLLNETRFFDPEGEKLIAKILDNFVDYEINNLKIKEIDMDKIPLEDLGLGKYADL